MARNKKQELPVKVSQEELLKTICTLEMELQKGLYRENILFEMLTECKRESSLKDIRIAKLEETIENLVNAGF